MNTDDRRFKEALDRHITGNYGEDQYREEDRCKFIIVRRRQRKRCTRRVIKDDCFCFQHKEERRK